MTLFLFVYGLIGLGVALQIFSDRTEYPKTLHWIKYPALTAAFTGIIWPLTLGVTIAGLMPPIIVRNDEKRRAEKVVREAESIIATGPITEWRERDPIEIDHVYKIQTGGAGQYARVKIRFTILPPGSGFVFVNSIVDGAIPAAYIPGVEKGLKVAARNDDVKAELLDGAFHDIDSSILSFQIAAQRAYVDALTKGLFE
jgi:hypothetical protein